MACRGNARANIPATTGRNTGGATKHSEISLQSITGMQRFRRMASCDRFKTAECPLSTPYFCVFTKSSVRDYALKIDLEDAYFHVPILHFAYESKVY